MPNPSPVYSTRISPERMGYLPVGKAAREGVQTHAAE
jgi:hypothetical protein